MLEMDRKLIEDLWSPFYTPFMPSKLLINMQIELNVFNLDIFDEYLTGMMWPYIDLDREFIRQNDFWLR